MKVKELIEVLGGLDPELPIVTYAHGHSYHSEWSRRSHGGLMVGLYHRGYDDADDAKESHGVIIGNIDTGSGLRFNYPNDWVMEIVMKAER